VPLGRFDNASLTTMLPSLPSEPLQMSSFAAPMTQGRALETDTIVPEAAQAIGDLHRVGKGVCWALGIEGAAALCLYAIWHLWQLWP
jgi:hypothetical protein